MLLFFCMDNKAPTMVKNDWEQRVDRIHRTMRPGDEDRCFVCKQCKLQSCIFVGS